MDVLGFGWFRYAQIVCRGGGGERVEAHLATNCPLLLGKEHRRGKLSVARFPPL